MAGVVSREIYGPLTRKKEYLEIIQNSGRYLLSVNEISELGALDETIQSLTLWILKCCVNKRSIS